MRDAEGLHVDAPGTISTYTGRRVAPLRMELDDIDIDDIAHALAHICRYGGHSVGHLSVARHSIWVADWVQWQNHTGKRDPQLELTALLHDAAEAYLGDIVRPLKQTTAFATYLEAEERLEAVLATKFGTVFPIPEFVKEGDRQVLNTVELDGPMPGGARRKWDERWQDAEYDFLRRFHELNNLISPRLIVLSGYAGVGKDTLGGVITDYLGHERAAFADVMREGLLALDPWILTPGVGDERRLSAIVAEAGWDAAKRAYPEIRELQQRFGTEAGRDIHGQDVWVNLALGKLDPEKKYVFTDCRFLNEAVAIQKAGGQVWRINREDVGPANDHISEIGLDGFAFDRVLEPPRFTSKAGIEAWFLDKILPQPVLTSDPIGS